MILRFIDTRLMAFPSVRVTGDPAPTDHQVNITVEVVEQFTDHSPARLRIEFANEAPDKREILFHTIAPFDALVGRTDAGEKVHAIPNNDNPDSNLYSSDIPRSPVDGCWRLDSPNGSEGFGILWPAEPEATTAMTYSVLSEPDATDCLPAGEYRFEDEWGELLPDDEDVWHSWGFTAELQP